MSDRQEVLVASWSKLLINEPEVALRMLLVRYMLEQRGITARALAPVIKVSHESISQTLRPTWIRGNDEPYRENTISVTNALKRLDLMEHGITKLTRKAGGVFTLTGTSPRGRLDFSTHLSEYQTRRDNDAYEF